jgi:polar amino acid transport system ATP-binding protein
MSTDPTSTAVPRLTIRNVSKSFGNRAVLRDVSLDVHAGEAVAVIGPSGSGKTTMLRCINLLEEYEAGEIALDGETVHYRRDAGGRRMRCPEREITAMRAQIGMVFQSFNLFPHMTVLRNVMVGPMRVKRTAPAEAEALARSLLERVGLSEKVDEYPVRLSGGQQQRVAIARALAMQPKLMLLDEVTSALDPELVGEVLEVIKQLVADGMTVVLVTHEMQFARDVAHRVVFMDQGCIAAQGSPDYIFGEAKSERLHAFLKRYRDAYLL